MSGGTRNGSVRTGAISNESPRLLITRNGALPTRHPSTASPWHALCSNDSTRADAEHRGNVAEESAVTREATPRLFCGAWAQLQCSQAIPKNTKP